MKILEGGFLKDKKIYVTAVVGIMTAVGSYLIGELGLVELVQVMFPLLGVIFLKKEMNTVPTLKASTTKSKKK